MRDLVVFHVTCAASTGSASSLHVTPIPFPSAPVSAIEVVIPYGNRGAVGFALGMAGTPIIPSNSGSYVSGDDTTLHWPVSGYPDSGAWELHWFNAGAWPHTLEIRFLLESLQQPAAALLQPLPAALISSGVH